MASDRVDDRPASHACAPTILIVEDEMIIRSHIADSLRDRGFQVLEAEDGGQAMRVIDGGEPVDLVFTDVSMPGELDGFELARHLRARAPRIPVILTSGHYDGRSARRALEDELFLEKPYKFSELVAHIRTLLGE